MAAVAVAPYIIRWGPDGWQDMLRQNARCTECGKRGVALQHPMLGRRRHRLGADADQPDGAGAAIRALMMVAS